MTVSESRFFMWRAIIAMAHADKILVPEERDFIARYLESVPFSDVQRSILREDLETPEDAGKMLTCVTDPEDRATFFQFGRMLAWCDGDFDAQERKILDRLKTAHLNGINMDSLRNSLQQGREDSRLQRLAEENEFQSDARKKLGLGPFLSRLGM